MFKSDMLEDTFVSPREAFARQLQEFVVTSTRSSLRNVFPGYSVSPGDCFFPLQVEVREPYSSFVVRRGKDKPTSLAFSHIVFAGYVDGSDHITNVSDHAQCSQSSYYSPGQNARDAIVKPAYSTNVHTKRELSPWWKATFPENIRVRYIYLYRRADWNGYNDTHLRVSACMDDQPEQVLFYPEKDKAYRNEMALRCEQALTGLSALRADVPSTEFVRFDAYVDEALQELSSHIDDVTAYSSSTRLGRVSKRFGRMIMPAALIPEEPAMTPEARVSIGEKLVKAASLALQGSRDFGYRREDALKLDDVDCNSRFLRFRARGELPPGLLGCEIYAPDGTLLRELGKDDLNFGTRPSVFNEPETYRLALVTEELRSRVVDLGDELSIGSMMIWNLNRQHAGTTSFLEIAVRNSEDENWQVIYDGGNTYRSICHVLKLVDYIVREAWTPDYAHLLGKLFTQYRRRRMAKPLARLVRDHDEFNQAAFEGSNSVADKVRYAVPLKLGKHGLQVPIAYRDEKEVMEHLSHVCEKVREVGHTALLMYGTLLGAVRERDFIPHDDDLDLAVIIPGAGPEDLPAERDKLLEALNSSDLKCTASTNDVLLHCRRNAVVIDIFVIGHQGDTIHWPHTGLQIRQERADIFLPTGKLEFKGQECDVPHDPEAVCEARYGSTWRTPIQSFEW